MADTPPPKPLPKQEFKERYKPGIPIEDVDPALKRWSEKSKFNYNVGIISMLIASFLILTYIVLSVLL